MGERNQKFKMKYLIGIQGEDDLNCNIAGLRVALLHSVESYCLTLFDVLNPSVITSHSIFDNST